MSESRFLGALWGGFLSLAACGTVIPPHVEVPVAPQTEELETPRSRREAGDSEQAETLAGISADDPIYFAVGFHEGANAKFQFSFKYRVFDPDGDRPESERSFEEHLYIGYTQTSLWDLQSASKPFYDSSYRPRLFWRDARIESLSGPEYATGVEFGFEHMSNGKAGDDSRSINVLYFQPRFDWSLNEDEHLVVEPRLIAYLDKSDNSDIDEYRGYGNLRIAYFDEDGLGVTVDGRIGSDWDHGAVELQATYPFGQLLPWDVGGFLFVQWFNGWGESMLDYDQHSPWQLRVGFALVR